jgi:monoamine oxidase
MKKAKTPLMRYVMIAFQKANQDHTSPVKGNFISRRKFLEDTGKTAVLLGVASVLPIAACKNGSKGQPRIAIVGGGIAGLHCAYILQKAGIDSTVYEADKRTGGRMFSKMDVFGEGLSVEYGGEFIDSDHEDMWNLINEFGLETMDTHKDDIQRETFYFDEKHFTEEEVIAAFKEVIPVLGADIEACGPYYDTETAIKLDQTPLEEYINSLPGQSWFRDLLNDAYLAEFGLDTSEQSTLNFLDMIGMNTDEGFKVFGDSDERYKVIGGNQKIPDALADKVRDSVRFEHRLTALRQEGKEYKLVFNDDKEITADLVLLAIPYTILRKIPLEVEGMSEIKRQCIDELGYGQNNKVMLGIGSRVWREGNPAYGGYLFHKDVHNGWDNSHMQNGNAGPAGFTVFLGGTPSMEVAAKSAEAGLKDSVPEEVVNKYVGYLDPVFPGFKEAVTGMHKAALWSNNPFVNASYACYKPGQWSTIAGHEFEPVGNLYFAGEHCSEAFQGYMNGAAETGRLVAEEWIRILSE